MPNLVGAGDVVGDADDERVALVDVANSGWNEYGASSQVCRVRLVEHLLEPVGGARRHRAGLARRQVAHTTLNPAGVSNMCNCSLVAAVHLQVGGRVRVARVAAGKERDRIRRRMWLPLKVRYAQLTGSRPTTFWHATLLFVPVF